MQEILNSRELALLTWIGVILLLMMFNTSFRTSLSSVLKAAFQKDLMIIHSLMLIYISLEVFTLFKLRLWNPGQLKNTLFWIITAAFSTLLNINKIRQNRKYYKDIIKELFAFAAFIEFIVGVHTFSYLIELFLLPVSTILFGCVIYAGTDKKNEPAKKLFSWTLSALAVFLVVYAVYWIATNFKSFATSSTFSDFVVPIMLSLIFLPFIYLLSLYMSYEEGLIGLDAALKKTDLSTFAKRKAVLHFKFRVNDFIRWKNSLFVFPVNTKQELLTSLQNMKKLNGVENNPPDIDSKSGWSPYKI